MAGEEYEPGGVVADEVNQWLVGCDCEFGFGWTGLFKTECSGCGGDGALFVDGDVCGVDSGTERRVGRDLGVGARAAPISVSQSSKLIW